MLLLLSLFKAPAHSILADVRIPPGRDFPEHLRHRARRLRGRRGTLEARPRRQRLHPRHPHRLALADEDHGEYVN